MQLYLQDNGWLSINDTSAALNVYFGGDGYDAARDAEVTGWVKAASATTDPEKRKEFFSKALKKISDQMYWLSMWTHPNVYAYTQELDTALYSDENPRLYFARWK
jgi:peptide/nickel transport system substrate-binding protein